MSFPRRAKESPAARWRRRLAPLGAVLVLPISGCVLNRAFVAHEAVLAPIQTATASTVSIVPQPASPPSVIPVAAAEEGVAASRPAAARIAPDSTGRPTATADPAVKPTSVAQETVAPTPPPPTPSSMMEEVLALPDAPVLPPSQEYPIDLGIALRLAENQNPEIDEARTGILAAVALQQTARSLLLPTLNMGTNYHGHTGNLQRSSGRILSLSEQSLYVGGGARTLAAESLGIPAVLIASPLTDAWFEPLAARQRLEAARFDAQATNNSVLLEVSQLYLELLRAEAVLEAQRLNESQYDEVAQITGNFSITGQGRKADADRALTQRTLRHAAVQKAEGDVAIASARLAERLNLDPSVRLNILAGPMAPISLIDISSNPEGLIQFALRRRPEVIARTASLDQANYQLKEEYARPLLPAIWLGFSGGGFGGGSNLSMPLLGRFKGRTDFDVRVIWTVLNMGQGNLALQKRRRGEMGAAFAERSREINRVRSEVTTALADAKASSVQVNQAQLQLQRAERGFQEDFSRARQALGRPIEVLDNLELLAEGRLELIDAITEYNQAQFRLFVALGSPPPLGPDPGPVAPPPITTPLHAPICDDPHPGIDPHDLHFDYGHAGHGGH